MLEKIKENNNKINLQIAQIINGFKSTGEECIEYEEKIYKLGDRNLPFNKKDEKFKLDKLEEILKLQENEIEYLDYQKELLDKEENIENKEEIGNQR